MKNWKIVLVLGLLILDCGLWFWVDQYNRTEVETEYLTAKHYLKSDFEEAFEKNKIGDTKGVSAMVTSHHFLAKDLIAKTLAITDKNKIRKIILISPDHFKQIENKKCLIETANVNWTTDFGIVEPETEVFKKIIKDKRVCQNAKGFKIEHGISVLIPFVKNYLPEASVLPMILKPKKDLSEFYELGKKMAKLANKNETLLIVSSDFSHYIPDKKAKEQDKISEKVLEEKDDKKIDLINNDCQQCIAFLFGYLDKFDKFELINNTNSFEISGENKDYVTSYINGYYVRVNND